MRKILLSLSIVTILGFAAWGTVEAGLSAGSGTSPTRGLPYGSYRVSPLKTVVTPPPPPPPPPPSGGVDLGGGSTPRLLRGGEADNTDAGARPEEPMKEKK